MAKRTYLALWDPAVLHHLNRPAPLLEAVYISFQNLQNIKDIEPVDLFGGSAGSLRSVTITRIPIKWDAPFLSGLTKLDLNSPRTHGLTLSALIPILTRCSTLESLDIGVNDDESVNVPDLKEPIALPRLKKLSIYASDSIVCFILANISVEAQLGLRVWSSTAPGSNFSKWSDSWATLLAPYITKSLETINDDDEDSEFDDYYDDDPIEIEIGKHDIRCRIPGIKDLDLMFMCNHIDDCHDDEDDEDYDEDLAIQCDEPYFVLQWLQSSFQSISDAPSVNLNLAKSKVLPLGHLNYLADLSITTLEVGVQWADELLLCLSTPSRVLVQVRLAFRVPDSDTSGWHFAG